MKNWPIEQYRKTGKQNDRQKEREVYERMWDRIRTYPVRASQLWLCVEVEEAYSKRHFTQSWYCSSRLNYLRNGNLKLQTVGTVYHMWRKKCLLSSTTEASSHCRLCRLIIKKRLCLCSFFTYRLCKMSFGICFLDYRIIALLDTVEYIDAQ